jgi:hypothetical protein
MSRTGRALPLTREKAAWSGGALLIGVDEVGRGPRAGRARSLVSATARR